MGRLCVGFSGVNAPQCLLGDFVTGGFFAVGRDMSVNAGILGTPLLATCLGDERSNMGGVLLVQDVEIDVTVVWVVHVGVSSVRSVGMAVAQASEAPNRRPRGAAGPGFASACCRLAQPVRACHRCAVREVGMPIARTRSSTTSRIAPRCRVPGSPARE